jgi:hypothetical protein
MSKRKDTEPFVPSEDEQGNLVEPVNTETDLLTFESEDNTQGETSESSVKVPEVEKNFKIYKSIYSGVTPIPVMIDGVKKYLKFDKHTYRTDNFQEQEALDAIMEADKNLPPKNRKVLNTDDFLELTSPDKVFVEVDGENLHISEIREAVNVAKSNGWKPTGKKVIILNTRSKINQGGVTASQGTI